MFEPNVEKVIASLRPTDLVLDVGGWACPFNRAQWVIDSEPFETRGFYESFGGPRNQGGGKEWFSRDTWVQTDICARRAWPFEDRQFDFAVCSHVLEDVRDPLWVGSELMRVAKRGYIETPSREFESCRGFEDPRTVGLSHHRWFVEYEGETVRFLMKYHFVHSHFRFSFPRIFGMRLPAAARVGWLWWDSSFCTEERTIHGLDAQMAEIERYVSDRFRYSSSRRALDRLRSQVIRVARGIRRRLVPARG